MSLYDVWPEPMTARKSYGIDGAVSFRKQFVKAERIHRQMIAAIWEMAHPDAIAEYIKDEGLVLDAMALDYPEFAAAVDAAAAEVSSMLVSAQSKPAHGGSVQTHARTNGMTTNTDFKKIVAKDVELIWPRIDQTYRYNSQEKRTEACPATVQGAGYSIAFKMPLKEGKALKDELRAHYEECRKSKPKLPEFKTVFGSKRLNDVDGNPTDFVQFTAKKRGVSNAGEVNKPPRVVGPDLKDLEDKNIWTGSIGNIRCLAFPTTDPDGDGGISLLLDAVQVIEAVYGGDSLEDDFGPARDVDPFGDEPEQTAKPAPDPAPIPEDAEF